MIRFEVGKSLRKIQLEKTILHRYALSFWQAGRSDGICRRILVLAALIGVGLRIIEYLYNRTLWIDEAMLALNFLHRSFFELLDPLDYNQVAPVGFLWLTKLVLQTLGPSDYSFRFLPLAAGIAGLVAFGVHCRRKEEGLTAVTAVTLFALSSPLIYYSAEFKPYSIDVLAAIVILFYIPGELDKALTASRAMVLLILGCILVLVSFPSIFALATVAFYGCWRWLHDQTKDSRFLAYWLVVSSGWALFFLFSLVVLYNEGSGDQILPEYSLGQGDLFWLPRSFFDLFLDTPLSIPYLSAYVAFPMLLLGFWYKPEGKNPHLFVLIGPLLFALLAFFLGRYPNWGRFMLFLSPSLLILIGRGVSLAWTRLGSVPSVSILLIGTLFFHSSAASVKGIFVPRSHYDVRAALEYLQDNAGKNADVWANGGAQTIGRYYGLTSLDLPEIKFLGWVAPTSWLDDLQKLGTYSSSTQSGSFWILLAHIRQDTNERVADQLKTRFAVKRMLTWQGGVVLMEIGPGQPQD